MYQLLLHQHSLLVNDSVLTFQMRKMWNASQHYILAELTNRTPIFDWSPLVIF